MATHSSVLAWRIPGTVEPGGLLFMGSQSRTRLKQRSSLFSMKKTKQNENYINKINPTILNKKE